MKRQDRQFPELLTLAETAAAFKVNTKTVVRWADKGRLKTVRTLGGHRRFYRDQVAALLRGEQR